MKTIDRNIIAHPLRVIAGRRGSHPHFFGCDREIRGLVPPGSSAPLHILYDLDLSDPALEYLSLDSSDRLLLVYPFRYNLADLAYRMRSSQEIEILTPFKYAAEDDWPYKNYPVSFDPVPVEVERLSYDTHKTLAFAYAVTSDLQFPERLVDRDRELLARLGVPFTQIGGVQNLPYGVPEVCCPNPKCEYHGKGRTMEVMATVRNSPVPGMTLWGENGGGVIIIYQMCVVCQSIYVCNVCD